MEDYIQELLKASEKLDSKTVLLVRCLILALLSYFLDGLQYRELRAALNISDGKLISNLNHLKAMGYIKESKAEIDKKKLKIYLLTENGKRELAKILKWMESIQKVSGVSDGEWQTTLIQ